MRNKGAIIKRQFDFFLKDFEPDPAPKEIRVKIDATRWTIKQFSIKLPPSLIVFHPYIVYIIFVYLKKYPFTGIDEKVAWTIPVKYKGTPLLLTHRKFGFDILSNYDTQEIQVLGAEAFTNILKCIPFAEIMFEPAIKAQVKKGNITLENNFKAIKSRYQFFRKKADREFKKAIESKNIKPKITSKVKGNMTSTSIKHPYARYVSAGSNYAASMMDAFYSLIEHTCVLLLPFLPHISITSLSLEEFIGHNWKAKLKFIIPPNNDHEAQKMIQRLDQIKEDLRNPLSHGHFLKKGDSFYVHIPQLGALPMTLTKNKGHFNYSFSPTPHVNYDTVCKTFDDFLQFLKTKREIKFALQYIETGLSVAFDAKSSAQYKSSMTTVAGYKEFIMHEFYQLERAINMDW